MRKVVGGVVVAMFWILAVPHLAWAVANASVTVTGADGQPLAGATVSLEGEPDQVTDSPGRACSFHARRKSATVMNHGQDRAVDPVG